MEKKLINRDLYAYPVIKPSQETIKCDVVIVGGGPNGLTAAAYLAKAGQKVIIVDRRNELGGGVATEEATIQGGFRHNIHAVYFMMTDYAPVYQDLNLEAYDLKHIHPPVQFAMPFLDGKSLCIYSDLDKTCNSIAQFSKKDADAYRDFFIRSTQLVDEFIAPATYAPPIPALEQVPRFNKVSWGAEMMEISEKSPKEVVDELFENERVQALMLYIMCMWGLDPDQSGVGYLIPLYINRSANYRLVEHGSHTLNQGFQKVIIENGGRLFNPYHVKRIVLNGQGEATGVELEDGPLIEARAVVSTLDTHQTFFDLVGEDNLDKEFAESTRMWQWEHWSLLGTHLALEEAPDFSAAQSNPDVNQALIYVLGYETPQDFLDHYAAIGRGEIEGKIGFNCCFPSVHDSSQAPPGRHTGLLSQMAPFELKNGGKDAWFPMKFKEEQGRRTIEVLRRYAPNLTDDKIRAMYIATPLDVENKFPDMVNGSIKQGMYHPLQMGYLRPNEYCSNHRSPIKNLFMGGACTYPGGTVLFGPGYLAANAVAEDLGITKWWQEPESVVKAREKGLL